MRVYRELAALRPAAFRSPAVTMGVFDGVHRGHRRLLAALHEAAARTGGEAVVLTFERHPRAVLGEDPPPSITTLEHRLELLCAAGVDAAVVLPFDRALAAMPAERFAREVLARRLGARAVVLGEDARFGHGRQGDLALLRRLAPELGFEVVAVPLLREGGAREGSGAAAQPVSSSAVRAAIAAARLQEAERLLGRPVTITGRVVAGQGLGRRLGVPTANLQPLHELLLPHGVYAAQLALGGRLWPAMMSIGVRPTVAPPGAPPTVEVHLIGFEGELYGQVLRVEVLARLRDEERFPSLQALQQAMARDREAALAVFARRRAGAAPGDRPAPASGPRA
ncbi:MAG: riboflavin biosynthesis protein [Planctomycetota bacterium]|nr:MAG: riboflavin biosynthesis protein [Planctomycetota bacterium]